MHALKLYEDGHPEKREEDIRILDAGCGDGGYAFALQQRGYKNINAIDLFDEIGEKSINYKKGSVDDIPFKDDYFDVVYCSSVIFYLNDVNKGMSEISRVTKDGGGDTLHSSYQVFPVYIETTPKEIF